MRNAKNSNFKDEFIKYIKENPATVFSTFCVLFELICSLVFVERTSFVSTGLMFVTTAICFDLHDKVIDKENENNKTNWF